MIYKECSGDRRNFCYIATSPQDAYISSNEEQNTNQEYNEVSHITRIDISIPMPL